MLVWIPVVWASYYGEQINFGEWHIYVFLAMQGVGISILENQAKKEGPPISDPTSTTRETKETMK